LAQGTRPEPSAIALQRSAIFDGGGPARASGDAAQHGLCWHDGVADWMGGMPAKCS